MSRLTWTFLILATVRDLPAFDLPWCIWNATDILVMVPAKAPYTLRVVESIKGARAGTEITLNDYFFRSAKVTTPLRELTARPGSFAEAPPLRGGNRAILFLRRPGAGYEYNPWPDTPVDTEGWQPASAGDMLSSTVWLEDSGAYIYRQTISPGPRHLISWSTEVGVREVIHEILEQRASLDRALGRWFASDRAADLTAIVRYRDGYAEGSALAHLVSGGAPGAEALKKLLADESLFRKHDEIIQALLKTAVRNFSFGEILHSETRYWSQTCRTLPGGWWYRPPYDRQEIAKIHYRRLYSALQGVRRQRNRADLPAVHEVSASWKTCPPLDDREPLETSGITQECEFLLGPAFH